MEKRLLHPIFYFLFLIIFTNNIFSQECEECNTRNIVIFDNQILVPRPTGPDSILATAIPKWWDLFYITTGEDKYFNTDPTNECFVKLCEAYFIVKDTIVYNISHGVETANCAPEGSIGGTADYIITGTVTWSDKNYTLKLNLETAKTREIVKSVTNDFSDGFDPFKIGNDAISQLGPIYSTIMNFERIKRDSGNEYAINPKIEVKPEKPEISAKESTNVEFTLIDCDGVALKNRKINLTNVTLGKFEPSEITTDDQGKATSKFTANDTKGTAVISASYEYKKAYSNGTDASRGGNAFIQIDEPPHWLAEGDYKYISQSFEEMSGSNAGGGYRSNEDNYRMEEGSFVSTFKVNEIWGDYFSENPPVAVLITGSSTNRKKYDYLMNIPGTGSERENEKVDCSGKLPLSIEGEIGVAFYSSGAKSISFKSLKNMTFSGSGYSTRTNCNVLTGCNTENDNSDCSNGELFLSFGFEAEDLIIETDTSYYAMGLKVHETRSLKKTTSKIKDNKYKFTFADIQTRQIEYDELGKAFNRSVEKHNVDVEVTAPGYTSVEENKQVIQDYCLNQNYPNPFNPSTTISYYTPKAGFVSLKIFNPLGEEIKSLVNEVQNTGKHSITFNGSSLPSGVYFYRLKAGNFVSTKKLILIK